MSADRGFKSETRQEAVDSLLDTIARMTPAEREFAAMRINYDLHWLPDPTWRQMAAMWLSDAYWRVREALHSVRMYP